MWNLSKPRAPKDCFRGIFVHFTMPGDLHIDTTGLSVHRMISCIAVFPVACCFERFDDVPSFHWYHPLDEFIILRNLRKYKGNV